MEMPTCGIKVEEVIAQTLMCSLMAGVKYLIDTDTVLIKEKLCVGCASDEFVGTGNDNKENEKFDISCCSCSSCCKSVFGGCVC